MRWGPADVARFAHGAGFRDDDLTTAVAVALATSDGDDGWAWTQPGAPGLWRFGLWGVRPFDAGAVGVYATLTDPNANASAAFKITEINDGWSWAPAFANGAYAPFLAPARDVTAPGARQPYPSGPAPSTSVVGAVRYAVDAGRRAVGTLLDGAAAIRSLNR